jgi:hypothetical protein
LNATAMKNAYKTVNKIDNTTALIKTTSGCHADASKVRATILWKELG